MTAMKNMNILVTGGTGFVMSNTVKQVLESNPEATAVLLDLGPMDGPATGFLDSVRDRVTAVRGDVRDRDVLVRVSREHAVTHVIHAATVTHFPQWEREKPAGYIDVNVMGTVNVLEWARGLDGLRQFLYVSSGGVYGDPAPDSPEGPQPETGPFNPPELYAIAKLTSEQVVRRYGELFEIDTVAVRLSGVFGPMERCTPGRIKMSMPYHMMRALIEDRPFRVTAPTLAAGGDFLSAEDVARALSRMLHASGSRYDTYNIAYGTFTRVADLLDAFRNAAPAFHWEIVEAPQADVAMNPDHRRARWNAYAINRVSTEFGWRPRPLAEQLRSYHEWVMADPDARCPPIAGGHMLSDSPAP